MKNFSLNIDNQGVIVYQIGDQIKNISKSEKHATNTYSYSEYVFIDLDTPYFDRDMIHPTKDNITILGTPFVGNKEELASLIMSVIKYDPSVDGPKNGFIDYNHDGPSFSLSGDVWTDLPNNGLGAFTNKNYLPEGVTELMDVSNGYIDCSELNLGDSIFIRNDYTITPNTNNSLLKIRYVLGSGGGLYTLETTVGRLDSGSGQPYRFSLKPDLIYMGDDNTRLNPIKIQINCSANSTVQNAGTVITVKKR